MIKRVCLILWVLLAGFELLNAQTPKWLWAKQGRLSSAQSFATTRAEHVITDAAGNSYVAGYFSSDSITFDNLGVGNPGAPFSNLFVAKYDANGNILWVQRTYNCYFSYAVGIAFDQSVQKLYVTGRYGAFSASNSRFGSQPFLNQYQTMYLAQLETSNGTVNWVREGIVGPGQNINTSVGFSIATRGDNFIYVAGNLKGDVIFDGTTVTSRGNGDAFLAKYNSAGSVIWVKTAGAQFQQNSGAYVSIDPAGGIYLAGNYAQRIIFNNDTITGNNGVFVAKYDSLGNYKWARGSGGSNNSNNGVRMIATDSRCNVYVTGTYLSTSFAYGSYSISNSTGNYKVYIAKLDSAGQVQWLKDAGVNYNTGGGPGIVTDKNDNFYLIGSYGPTPATIGSFTLNPVQGPTTRDIFVARYDTAGTPIWAKTAGGSSDDYGYGISVDGTGNVYTTGILQSSTVSFDSIQLSGILFSNIFIAKIGVGGIPPVAQFGLSDTLVCAGSTITFTDLSTGTPTGWDWTFSGGTPLNPAAQNPTVTYSTPGTYSVKLVVRNAFGTDSITRTGIVRVSGLGNTGILSASPDSVCEGNAALLSVAGSTGSLQWQSSLTGTGFADVAGADSVTYPVLPQQTTYYRIIAGTGTCADTSQPFKLVVNPLPSPPAITIADTIICSNDSTKVCAIGNFASYLWNTGATSACIFAKAAGGYWLSATDANGCTSLSARKNLAIYPVSSVSVVVQGDTLASFGAVYYQWFKGGVLISGATNSIYIARETGEYSVQITDVNGCNALSTPVYIDIAGIQDVNMEGIMMYPNPAKDKVVIRTTGPAELRLVNMLGQEIQGKLMQPGNNVLDISWLPEGVYEAVFYYNGQLQATRRLIHQSGF